ncbi:DNA ligase D [Notoacmeibacter sp. MSK16QG-6]|uniref:DNA ligase D n=1 Tax=Notoacmeibacter sp. MSK16QG-6 TaxID=2957982 RepID=UPI00209CD58F|nr:DNA ligase D [Notoacmeibacter sp. MSK16QG-6]MCP1200874.1 DNA ligase D [Notoacmeibacter sp. MSK16QG-6]
MASRREQAAEALKAYDEKRDFSKTAEPSSSSKTNVPPSLHFLVQKHDATRLHYDFRLAWNGVLLSWAVTRGPSLDPGEKRLAVRTEDHPLSYGDFEGTIPKGQYGGGTVMLWDHGAFAPLADFEEGLAEGKLKFELFGQRMVGGWTLVKMKGRPSEKRENWLLIKERDGHAVDEDAEGLIERNTLSVKTGRTLKQIADGAKARDLPEKGRAARQALPAQNKGRAKRKTGKLPPFREPQLATLVDDAPEGEDWLHETKYDGYRCIAAIGGGEVHLWTRNGKDWTERYKGVPDALVALSCKSAMIDGEIVSLHGGRGSAFSALQADLEAGAPLRLQAFDLLELDGKDLTDLPLTERKEKLEALIADGPESVALGYSEHIAGDGPAVFKAIAKAGGEGIISKKADAKYRSGRNRNFLKIKAEKRQEFVIGGWSESDKKGRAFSSLLLGVFDGDDLVYRGRVGSGFNEASMDELAAAMKPLSRKTMPFTAVPREFRKGAHWVTPKLVAEVKFAELTADGHIRHGVFLGLRKDKPADAVVDEKTAGAAEASIDEVTEMGATKGRAGGKAKASSPSSPKKAGGDKVAGITITSDKRVIFDDAKWTKRDVAEWADAAGERLFELAGKRPLSLVRCPGGVRGGKECFFQKHYEGSFPPGIGAVKVTESDGDTADYLMVETPQGFVAAAQMGTIEFHPWIAAADRLDKPDRIIFDLDPDEGLGWGDVKSAATDLRDLLADLGIATVPVVTGGKGIHVTARLRRIADYDTVTLFAQTLAAYLGDSQPKRFTANMRKAKRGGRIFVDWLRNQRGATAASPYSLRARKGGPLAMPVTWDELQGLKAANTFDLSNGYERLDAPCPLIDGTELQSIGKPQVEGLEKLMSG